MSDDFVSAQQRILVVEDDLHLAEGMAENMRAEGYAADTAHDGKLGLEKALAGAYDLLVLDVMLPQMDGFAVCKALRAQGRNTPVLFLTARGDPQDRVRGLEAGGDDYLTKPFGYSELSARLANLLRRAPAATAQETMLSCGDLQFDLLARQVTRGGKRLDLLPRELKLLEYFLRHKNRVVTRTMLLEQVWDYRFDPHTSVVDTHISRLRKKIDDPFATPLLHTLRGTGYRLSETP
jgi:two-component system OmpR family response regulator